MPTKLETKIAMKIDYAVLIKTFMEKQGISIKDLSKIVDVHNRAVYGWIAGESIPSHKNYRALIETFGNEFGLNLSKLDNQYGRLDFYKYQKDEEDRLKAEIEARKESEQKPEPAQEPAPQKPEPEQKPEPAQEIPKFIVFTDTIRKLRRLVNVADIERIHCDASNRIAVTLHGSQNSGNGAVFVADDDFDTIVSVLGATVITPMEDKT